MDHMNDSRNSNFLIHGSILAIASIISRIIGLLYRLPLTNIIGDVGNNYFSAAFDLYNMVFILTAYCLPTAVARMVSARLAKGQKKRAYRLLPMALLYALLAGLVGGGLLWGFSEILTGTVLKTPLAMYALRVLSPILLLTSLLGVFRGFFQGLGDMVPTAVSQILEQIVNAIVSIWAAYVLYTTGCRVGVVLGDEKDFAAAYSAAGGTLGIGAGAAAGILFMLIMLGVYSKRLKADAAADQKSKKDSVGYIFRTLFRSLLPIMLSTAAFNLCGLVDQVAFKNVALLQGYTQKQIGTWWGIYDAKYKLLAGLPLAAVTAAMVSVVPALAAAYAGKKKEEMKVMIGSTFHYAMVTAFPGAVILGVLAEPALRLLFPTTADTLDVSARMLWLGAAMVVLYSAAILTNGFLQGINRLKLPVRNASAALVIQTVILILLMLFLRLNIYAVVIANMCFALIVSFLNGRAVMRYTGWRLDPLTHLLKPFLSAMIMGILVFVLYMGLKLIAGSEIAFAAGLLAGLLIYPTALFLMRGITEDELLQFPQGRFWAGLAKKLHLL